MTRHLSRRRARRRSVVVLATLMLAAACVAVGTPTALASPGVPDPGSPGSLAFPSLTPGAFATPPAAARVKYRWWQPAADTNDAELQREVASMAGNFAGGFEQNGFPVSTGPLSGRLGGCNGCTSQFYTFAASQQFTQQYGWGTPLWSHRNAVSQQAAAQDGLIGDMNEGSEWDNTVPTVYSPNQEADQQDLSYGMQQYQPGQDPSGELPPVTAPALGGESTVLSDPANPGDANLQVQSVAGLLAGDQITLGRGSAAETATIKSVGTPSAIVPLSQPATSGTRVVHVPPATAGTGVPGTAEEPAQFVPGETVTVGSGASAEHAVIADIGTFDIATAPTTLVLPPGGSGSVAAPAGATNVEVASNTDFLKGDTITVGSGDQAETRTISSVGGPGSGTTLSAATAAGALQIGVARASELEAGQYITIGVGTGQETDRIASVSGSTLTFYSPLKTAHGSGDPLALKSVGVSFAPALSNNHSVGETAIDRGTGIALRSPLGKSHPAGDTFVAPGTGVTLTAPLIKTHSAGVNDAVATTLSAASTASATSIKVASVTNLAPGDQLTVGHPGYTQTVTITSVGTSGPDGTGVTFSPALSQFHYAGDPVVDATSADVTNASGGVSDIEKESLVAAQLVQCLSPSIADTKVAHVTALSGPAAAGDSSIAAGPLPYTGNPTADWIWSTPGAASNAAAGDVYLRKTFTTPAGVTRALLRINADDAETTYVNGVQVASSVWPNWPISQNADITKDLNPAGQENVIAVAANNRSASASGVIAAVQIDGSSPQRIVTDPSWKAWPNASAPPAGDWNTAGYDDSSWENAFSAGAFGIAPWGTQPDGSVGEATSLAVGDRVTVGAGSAAESRTITAISGSTLTLDKALSSAHPNGEGVWDTCTSAPGHTRELDPTTAINVTKDVKPNALNWTEGSLHYGGGSLPAGNGQPWELIDFYLDGDTKANDGNTATSPNQWMGHLSVASAKAMTDYFDKHILNDPATRAAIAYQDAHTGTPAVFEDSLENANNLNWVPDMISSWRSDLGYDPTALLPALAGTGRNATGALAFDFPQDDGQGATLGWRLRDDYGQMWNDLYINRYMKTLDDWAASRGLVARFQSYGDPIDAGESAAYTGIPEAEHYEFAGQDETQQFKVRASGMYQTATPHFLSNECCEAQGQVWADPFGMDGTGSGASPAVTEPNAESVYADQAGGDSQIIYHGWPYANGVAGSKALWPGYSYGGNDTYAAGNGPNQPQFADDRTNNIAVARHDLVLRQGQPSFDVAVFHEDFGLGGQGQDNLTNGWNMGTVMSNGVTSRPTSGKIIRSSSSLSQAGFLYGYVSPAFFRYPTATFSTDPQDGSSGKVLFPGHGDYKSLVLYDQSVMPVDVADKIVALAAQGLPIVIIGQVPNAAPNATGGTVAGMQAADQQVQAAMAKVTAAPNTKVVANLTASGSQSSDANAPAALKSLGIDAATQLNTSSAVGSGTATPVIGIRRHETNIDYYQLFNSSATSTARTSVTLTGQGIPYLLDAWTGKITPIANFTATGDRVTISLRIAPGNTSIVAVTPGNNVFKAKPKLDVHATGTTADATGEGVDNVVYDSSGNLVARAGTSGTYQTTLSDGTTVTSTISVPTIDSSSTVSVIGGRPTLTDWQLSVDSWTQTPSGDPTKTQHTPIPASGSFPVTPLNGVTNGTLPSWTAITPQNIPGLDPADNLTNVAGIGAYTTSFSLPADWSTKTGGAYLNIGAAIDTVDIWVNGKAVAGVDENDRNQVDIGPYLQPGTNQLKISVATPLRNAVAVAPATPATGQVPNSAETIGDLQEDALCPGYLNGPGPGPCTSAPGFTTKLANVGLIGPVTLMPYGQSTPLN